MSKRTSTSSVSTYVYPTWARRSNCRTSGRHSTRSSSRRPVIAVSPDTCCASLPIACRQRTRAAARRSCFISTIERRRLYSRRRQIRRAQPRRLIRAAAIHPRRIHESIEDADHEAQEANRQETSGARSQAGKEAQTGHKRRRRRGGQTQGFVTRGERYAQDATAHQPPRGSEK